MAIIEPRWTSSTKISWNSSRRKYRPKKKESKVKIMTIKAKSVLISPPILN